jgi:hypothetical protein
MSENDLTDLKCNIATISAEIEFINKANVQLGFEHISVYSYRSGLQNELSEALLKYLKMKNEVVDKTGWSDVER